MNSAPCEETKETLWGDSMAMTEAGGGYTPTMATGTIMPRPGLPTRGATGASARGASLVDSSR